MRVLVTGARTYYALPVIRILGRRDVHVTAADWDRHALGFYSRFTRTRFVHPRVSRDPRGFVEALAAFLENDPHDVVLPLYEEALALARYRDLLPPTVRLPLPDYATVLSLHDKRALYAFASTAGVPVPNTVNHLTPESFPVILKVPQSSSARGVVRANNHDELIAAMNRLHRSHNLPPGIDPIVQTFVDGEQICSLSFAWYGELMGTLLYRNVVEFPANGGAGIVRIGIKHANVELHVETLIRESGWHGVVGFDFMVEQGTGCPFLIDANPRMTPAVLLAQRSGLDLLAMATAADPPHRATNVIEGLRTRSDPLVFLFMLESLIPRRGYLRRIKLATSFLERRAESRSDVFDRGDLASLRGLFPLIGDVLLNFLLCRSSLDMIRDSQYCDYETPLLFG